MSTFAWVVGLHWAAVVLYAAATILVTSGATFRSERASRIGRYAALPAIAIHGAGLLVWWRLVGHGPYIDRFEVLSANAWVLAAGFEVFARIYPRIRVAGAFVYPATFLVTATGLFMQPEIKTLPPTFRGVWLVLHIIFYKIAFCAVVIALAFSVIYLLREKGRLARFQTLPELPTIDLYAYRFAGFGFTFWAIGMLAGSIWAYQSWNVFWNWDPVQTWSLIAWALFGLYLHMRRFFGWNGARAAYLFTLCFVAVVVALYFTPLIESSIHADYFK